MLNRFSPGDELRTERLSRGWTQSELGERAGLARTWIAMLEAGLPDRLLAAMNTGAVTLGPEPSLPAHLRYTGPI